MTVPMLLVSILLAAIMLALPGVAPYVHGFVSLAKYPAYAHFTWHYAPSVLRRLILLDTLALRIARLNQRYHSTRRSLSLHSLVYAGFSLSLRVLRTAVTRTGVLPLYGLVEDSCGLVA
ncbi:hypothetical protein RhiJN_27788 [Ceratobasidium sp. AG-Ba]|nr:hypothetical protein RhiJN_27788 [Ceratobasidium sp. AG-Ba]